MKSLRNIFRSKGHKEEKENLDESRHVTFLTPSERRASKRVKKSQRTFADDTALMRPSYAYDAPAMPATRKPTRSCPGGPGSPAVSSDDETLVADRCHKRATLQLPSRRQQQLELMAFRASAVAEYDDPSPMGSVLYRRQEAPSNEKYWKDKYVGYKERSRALKDEVRSLRAQLTMAYEEQRKQASVLTEQLRSITVERDQLKQKLELQAPPWSSAHSTYQYGRFAQPLLAEAYPRGAGEHLASHPALPSTNSSCSNPSQHAPPHSSGIVDEVKNFRAGNDSSSMDDSRQLNVTPATDSSPENLFGPISLNCIPDDGYFTTHESAKGSAAPSDVTTPLAPPRLVRSKSGTL